MSAIGPELNLDVFALQRYVSNPQGPVHTYCRTCSLRFENNLFTVEHVRFASKIIFFIMCSLLFENNFLSNLMCSLHFEKNFLTDKHVRFALKIICLLSKVFSSLRYRRKHRYRRFCSLALPLLFERCVGLWGLIGGGEGGVSCVCGRASNPAQQQARRRWWGISSEDSLSLLITFTSENQINHMRNQERHSSHWERHSSWQKKSYIMAF